MPRGALKDTVSIDRDIFKKILKLKGYKMKDLSEIIQPSDPEYICSERTLSRSLNKGIIRSVYLNKIAKKINVDPRFLSGDIYKYNSKYSTHNINYYYRDIDKFPYSREAYDKIRQQDIKAHLSSMFALFEISYEQFESLDFETQYNLQHDLFEAISTILGRYFKVDALGNKEMYGLEQILIDLESYRESFYEHQYADTTLRERFSANPPDGYSRDDIKNMPPDELITLDMDIQWATIDDNK